MTILTRSLATASLAAFGWVSAATGQDVVLEVSATQPEYFAQDRAIWDLYEDENPGVAIELFSINEDTEAAYQARVAGGDPADMRSLVFPTKDNYQTYLNLAEIDFPWWDLMTYDAKTIFEQTDGVAGYTPAINVRDGLVFNFVYYADKMAEAGLDPSSIRTVDELNAFLADLKTHVEGDPDLEYVLDVGWHPRAWGRWILEAWAIGLGAIKEDMRALWTGEIAWTDVDNNPLVPALELAKDYTEQGYFPPNWWNRAWEQEFEASFIAGRSILAYHGPWIWNKTLAQRPDADLAGFFFPANEEGVIWQDSTTADRGSALYVANLDDENLEAAKDALYWWTSPEIVKLRAEAIGFVPAMDLSSVGGVELTNPQYVKLIKPALDGQWGEITFDNSLGGQAAGGPLKKSGAPFVIEDNSVAPIMGQYMSGEMSLEEFLGIMQERYDEAYGS
ncbi:MAG: ABC transporter substrate-binding protein [Pseudomonadota bacterium]